MALISQDFNLAKNSTMRFSLSQKILGLFILGMSSGLPAVLIGSTLQAWFTYSGASLISIGFLSLIGLPYTYKFLWSFFLDRFDLNIYKISQHRAWILLAQFILIFLLFLLANFSPSTQPKLLAGLALVIAFISATQDIASSGYLVDIGKDQSGPSAASFITGYRISMIIAGALALILADHLGFKITYQIMSSLMFLFFILNLLFIPNPTHETLRPKNIKQAITEPFLNFFKKYPVKISILILLLLFFYKLGNAFLFTFNTVFLLRILHFSLTDLALANKIMGLSAALLGGVIAGLWMRKLSLFQALLIFGLIQALANLGYVLLAFIGGTHFDLMASVLFIEYFCSALGSTAFIALTMHLCDLKYSASQYALLNSLESVGTVYLGPIAGFLLVGLKISWPEFYLLSFLLCIPGLVLVLILKKYF